MNQDAKKNGAKRKQKKQNIVKKVFLTSTAASALIVAALLLTGFFMQKQAGIQKSGDLSEAGFGQGTGDDMSSQGQWSDGTQQEIASLDHSTQADPDGLDSTGQPQQSQLDHSYQPRQTPLGRSDNAQQNYFEENDDGNAGLDETGSQTNASDKTDGGSSQSETDGQADQQTKEQADSQTANKNQGSASNQKNKTDQTEESDQEAGLLSEADMDRIRSMTLEEKIAQLFVLTPEALTNTQRVTKAGEKTKQAVHDYPVGGLVYFKSNIRSEEQFVEMVKNVQAYSMERSGLPFFICVDEEGGSVARISGRGFADVPEFADMYEVGKKGNGADAYDIGKQIGTYLSRFQVNVDFAPVADVYSNPENKVIGKRAFGSDPDLAAKMAANEVYGLKSQKVAAVLKHFPGHGDTQEDSHSGRAYSYKTLDELRSCELVPFRAGIDAGADFVMVGHISLPNILDDEKPASLSDQMITEVLRGELEFDGIVITDALNMGAVTNDYSSAQAAVQAVSAGVDMLLMPQDFKEAYDGLLKAVRQGTISESRIDESLERILKVKKQL